ncbi:MAG TPA: MFS transporter [Microvirga sp.]|jgi:MFS family permease|nr:MFS transporter [Microvirga sp.]
MSPPDRMPWAFVSALSLGQLVSFGTIFYAFALFVDPMGRELGWGKSELTAAYSLALGTSAFCAVPVGRLIDLGHGRAIMTGGSLLAAAMLSLWSQVTSYPVFLLLWIGLGASMSAVFYEPGFAVLAQRLGFLARRGITFMTLVGGFASTVFIPLTHLLIAHYGWRGALLVLAGLNVLLCAIPHALSIPRAPVRSAFFSDPQASRPAASNPRRVLRQPAFWCFVVTSVLQGMISTGIPIHLIPLLVERGFSLEAAVAAFSVIGPAQVAARFAMAVGERFLSLRWVGVITMALSVVAFVLLPLVPPGSWWIAVFAGIYGAFNGMMTIIRALLPPELFGRGDYGAIQGMIAMPVRLSMATTPFLFGALWVWWGNYDAVMALCLIMALCSLGAFVLNLALAKEP